MSCDYCWPGNCCGGPNCLAAIEEDPRESSDPEVRAEAIKAWGPIGRPASEPPTIEEIVETLEVLADWSALDGCKREVLALIADWRAKKAALAEAILQLEYLHERCPTGAGEAVLTRLRQYRPPPPQSTASPGDSQDGQA